jgi:hypothetical protein
VQPDENFAAELLEKQETPRVAVAGIYIHSRCFRANTNAFP